MNDLRVKKEVASIQGLATQLQVQPLALSWCVLETVLYERPDLGAKTSKPCMVADRNLEPTSRQMQQRAFATWARTAEVTLPHSKVGPQD